MSQSDAPRRSQPPLMDALGKLCTEGKDLAGYLWQVPDDAGARQKILGILDQIGAEHDPDADRHGDRGGPPFGPPVERAQALEDRRLLHRRLLHGDRKLGAPRTPGNRSSEPVSWYNWNSQ